NCSRDPVSFDIGNNGSLGTLDRALSFPKETRQTQPFLLSTLRKAVIQHIKTILPPVNQTDFQEFVPGREKYSVLGIKETQ
ncbi:hypothetical protein IAQ61_006051, partial [Plenodomus lingam]|uniref:uncharacterized protein n=1 Tax=Leptosphaeria maculans TaxID=5022 RepID=UPI003332682C